VFELTFGSENVVCRKPVQSILPLFKLQTIFLRRDQYVAPIIYSLTHVIRIIGVSKFCSINVSFRIIGVQDLLVRF